MTRLLFARAIVFVAPAALLLFAAPASPQLLPRNQPNARPKLEPVAETKLIMEGLLQANVRGLEKNLRQTPTDQETWAFVRGQALLIAESGNLLMLRPPKAAGPGQDLWLESAAELRQKATALGRHAAARDVERCRRALVDLSGTCNRCHQTFRVNVQVTPFADR